MRSLTDSETPDLSFTDVTGGGGNNFLNWLTNKLFPRGAYYITETTFDPNAVFAGTWEELQNGTFIMAAGKGNFITTGGSNEHAITIDELPEHDHWVMNEEQTKYYGYGGASAGSGNFYSVNKNAPDGDGINGRLKTSKTGSGASFDIRPQHITAHIWKRTI